MLCRLKLMMVFQLVLVSCCLDAGYKRWKIKMALNFLVSSYSKKIRKTMQRVWTSGALLLHGQVSPNFLESCNCQCRKWIPFDLTNKKKLRNDKWHGNMTAARNLAFVMVAWHHPLVQYFIQHDIKTCVELKVLCSGSMVQITWIKSKRALLLFIELLPKIRYSSFSAYGKKRTSDGGLHTYIKRELVWCHKNPQTGVIVLCSWTR